MSNVSKIYTVDIVLFSYFMLISNGVLILLANILHHVLYIRGCVGAKKSRGSANFVVVTLCLQPLTFYNSCSVLTTTLLNVKSHILIQSVFTILVRSQAWAKLNTWKCGLFTFLRYWHPWHGRILGNHSTIRECLESASSYVFTSSNRQNLKNIENEEKKINKLSKLGDVIAISNLKLSKTDPLTGVGARS